MPRYYLKFLGGAAKVDTLVGLAPSNHGTTLDGLFTLASTSRARARSSAPTARRARSRRRDRRSSQTLNAGGDTVAGRELHRDRVGQRRGRHSLHLGVPQPAPNVTNILLQRQCALDQGEHLSMPYDHIADADVLTALDPADPQHPACTPVLPVSAAERRPLSGRSWRSRGATTR